MTLLAIAAIAACSPAVPQSTIERIVEERTVRSSFEEVTTPRVVGQGAENCLFEGSCSSFGGGLQIGAGAPSPVWVDPQLPGVALARLRIETLFDAFYSFELLTTDPNGTLFEFDAEGHVDNCGGGAGCTWGNSDGVLLLMDYGSLFGAPTPVGTTVSAVVGGLPPWANSSSPDVIDLEPGDWGWPFLLQNPGYWADVYFGNPYFTAIRADGVTPTTAVVTAAAGYALCDVTIRQHVSLTETPVITTCVSQNNSTGQLGALRAYGSRVAGTEWLTVRSSGLPTQQACLMFMGRQPAFVPAATYNLCVGGQLSREGGVQITNAQGEADHEVSLATSFPGDTLYCQVLHRDPVLGIGATEAVAFTVE